MGKIQLSSFRAPEVLYSRETIVKAEHPDKEKDMIHANHIEKVEGTRSEKVFPILPRNVQQQDLPLIPPIEVSKRDGKGDDRLWIVVDSIVLDVSAYQHTHPGGRSIVAGFGGQDCSWQWWSFHHRTIWQEVALGLRVGRSEGVANPYQRPRNIIGLRRFGFDDWD